MADGVHAVVDEGAAQKHAEGKDPQVGHCSKRHLLHAEPVIHFTH